MAAPESRAADPARTYPSPQRPSVHPARGRIRNRHHHRLLTTSPRPPSPRLSTIRSGHRRRRRPPCWTERRYRSAGSPPTAPSTPRKRKKQGMNVQVVADPFGGPLWASPAPPGAVHDVRAACEHGVIDALVRPTSPSGLARDAKGPRARSVFPAAAGDPPPLTQGTLPPHYPEFMLPPELSLPDSEGRFLRPRHQLQAVCPMRIAATATAANRTPFQVMATIALRPFTSVASRTEAS